MNVNQIRADLAAVGAALGWAPFAYSPEDPKGRALVAGPPRSIDYGRALGAVGLEIPMTLVASAASYEDAQRRLDEAVSVDRPASVVDALNGVVTDAVKKARVQRVENPRLLQLGQSRAFALDIITDVTALKREPEEGS